MFSFSRVSGDSNSAGVFRVFLGIHCGGPEDSFVPLRHHFRLLGMLRYPWVMYRISQVLWRHLKLIAIIIFFKNISETCSRLKILLTSIYYLWDAPFCQSRNDSAAGNIRDHVGILIQSIQTKNEWKEKVVGMEYAQQHADNCRRLDLHLELWTRFLDN